MDTSLWEPLRSRTSGMFPFLIRRRNFAIPDRRLNDRWFGSAALSTALRRKVMNSGLDHN
jgi:hypothetical protein